MPYIRKDLRERLLPKLAAFPINAGELNFILTSICVRYLGSGPRYEDYNRVIGALECAKLELYRRMVAPYEDAKIRENGDVYATS